jgi:hypothetical protein
MYTPATDRLASRRTPNRAAAARPLIPSPTTASITRSRKSCEYASAIPAGLRQVGRPNQNNADMGIPSVQSNRRMLSARGQPPIVTRKRIGMCWAAGQTA